MRIAKWIKSQAAAGDALNLHAVARNRSDLLEKAFAGSAPRGWYRSLVDAGVNPYKITHEHADVVHCKICDYSGPVLGTHLKQLHGVDRKEYLDEFGPTSDVSSESFRVAKFLARPIHGIAHWEKLWSRYYVIDWIIRLQHEGHTLNYYSVYQEGQSLTNAAIKFLGSWDLALLASGFNPDEERSIPAFQQWDADLVIQKLHEFAAAKNNNWRLKMPDDVRYAAGRVFGSLKSATKAAGLCADDLSHRAIFTSPKVANLVNAIRKLEELKGQSRMKRLRAIYHKDANSRRIVQNHYGSLRKLTLQEDIDPRLVSPEAYRDEADVHHDLDIIEQKGKTIYFKTLKCGHKRLYNVISETGWGRERLVRDPSC